jgi:glycosyltransferase involved in cell wall biosynthesis
MHILYVAEAPVSPSSGMGRIAWHWQQEALRRGHRWSSLTPAELGPSRHPALFPSKARRAFSSLAGRPDLIVAHEPAAASFLGLSLPLAVLSHGLERRQWLDLLAARYGQPRPGRKSRLLTPLWRIHPSHRAIGRADLLLLSNKADEQFVIQQCDRRSAECLVFRNGVEPSQCVVSERQERPLTIGFLASWLPRKGIATLLEAARQLSTGPHRPHWLLAGTGASEAEIRAQWPPALQDHLRVVPSFPPEAEAQLLAELDVFVLPSFYEGQPLSLLQAMAAGLPCVASACCGQLDLIEPGRTGLLFPPGDAAQLAACLTELLASDARRQQLGQAAQNTVRDRAWPLVSAEVIDRLELLLEESRHGSP